MGIELRMWLWNGPYINKRCINVSLNRPTSCFSFGLISRKAHAVHLLAPGVKGFTPALHRSAQHREFFLSHLQFSNRKISRCILKPLKCRVYACHTRKGYSPLTGQEGEKFHQKLWGLPHFSITV